MPSLGIALRPGGCPSHGTKNRDRTRHRHRASFPADATFHHLEIGDSGNPAFAISRGPRDAPPLTPEHGRRFNGMLLSPSPFRSRSAIGPRNLPPSSSRLSREYNQAPHGALPPVREHGVLPGLRIDGEPGPAAAVLDVDTPEHEHPGQLRGARRPRPFMASGVLTTGCSRSVGGWLALRNNQTIMARPNIEN